MLKILSLLFIANLSYGAIHFGTYVPNAFKAQNDTEGGRTAFAFNPFIAFDFHMQTPWGHYFTPEAGYIIHTDAEDESRHHTIFLGYNFEYVLGGSTLLRYGFSNFISSIGGDGDAVELKNGLSTSTFYAPSEARTSYNSSLNVGIKTFFNSNYGVRLDANIVRFLSSEKRSLSYTFSLVYK